MTNGTDRIFASYLIETAFPLHEAAEAMAGEQSTGTFVRLPGETDALREAHAARVEHVAERGTVASPACPAPSCQRASPGRSGGVPRWSCRGRS